MNPRSFSASSLETADLCLARYKAENIDYGRDFQGTAASVGIVCHGTFEDWLRAVYIKKTHQWYDEAAFRQMFEENYAKVFGGAQGDEYEDAWDLCWRWYHRDGQEAYFGSVKIISLESKLSHPMRTPLGEKPFNYIMDRVDRIDEKTIRVVDYKSNRVGLSEDELHKKRQARLYALMTGIKYKGKGIENIEVEFDFLRHRPVRTSFTREDNKETWDQLLREIKRIIEAPETRIPETLNANCGWCVRKADCKTLQSNIKVGGIMSKSVDELARIYGQLVDQRKGQKELADQIEMMLLKHAIENDVLEYNTETASVTVYLPTRRKVNNEVAAAVLGQNVSEHANFSVTTIEKLTKRNSPLPPGQRELLKDAIEIVTGDPQVKIEPLVGGNE